jgi:hypothetical protein
MEGIMEGLACIFAVLWLIGIIFACLSVMFPVFGCEDFADFFIKICAFFFSVGAVFFVGFVITLIYDAIC